MAKERLDVLLVKRNLVQSRERAKTTIMAGLVLVDGQKKLMVIRLPQGKIVKSC